MKNTCCIVGVCSLLLATASAWPQTSKKKPQSTGAKQQTADEQKSKRFALPWHSVMSAKEIFAKYHGQVVTIKTNNAQGTGFMFLSDQIVTCYHVVEGASKINVSTFDGKDYPITHMRGVNKNYDLACLSFDEAKPFSIPIGLSDDLAIGDTLYVIGSPEGLEQTLTEGILSGRRKLGSMELLQLSAAVSSGSSGSPVFNKYGEVVGMVVSSLKKGQQLNFAVSMKSINTKETFMGVPLENLFDQQASKIRQDAESKERVHQDITRGVFPTQRMLQGLTKFEVIATVEAGEQKDGLDENIVRANVFTKLKEAGILYYYHTDADFAKMAQEHQTPAEASEDNPLLWVKVNLYQNTDTNYIYQISVDVRQSVRLLRDPTLRANIPTWQKNEVGTIGVSNISNLHERVKGMIDQFLADYKLVNPKP